MSKLEVLDDILEMLIKQALRDAEKDEDEATNTKIPDGVKA